MGIDIGTTTSKGVITTPDGKIVAASGSFEHNISWPSPDRAEHDADKVWWADFVKVSRTLLEKSGIDPRDIAGVNFSTVYPTLLPVDKNGTPLRSGILYGIDRRAVKEIDYLESVLTSEYCRKVSGNGLSAQSIAPKILWIRNNEPEVWAKTYKFLNTSGYIAFKLTGEFTIDHGSASLGGVPYDLAANHWDAATLDAMGVTGEKLPKLVWADEVIGRVTAEAAAETGLAEGTPVGSGTGDHVTESLSQGFVQPGAASISFGTTFGTDVCIDKLVTEPGISTTLTCFKGLYSIGGSTATGASVTRWFRDNLAYFDEDVKSGPDFDPYKVLNEAALTVPAGCDGLIVLPYFSGERLPFFNPKARGALFGLTLNHSKEHIYRALMEGVAFCIRHTLDVIKKAGLEPTQAISTGGGTAGGVWPQIVSDVTGLKQQVLKASHGSPMGAAFLAGLMTGVITDRYDIMKWNEQEFFIEPNAAHKDVYDRNYAIFRNLYENTKDLAELL